MTLTASDTDRLEAIEAKVDALAGSVAALSELTSELSALGGDAFMAATERLAEADRRGYFDFAKAAAGVADQVCGWARGDSRGRHSCRARRTLRCHRHRRHAIRVSAAHRVLPRCLRHKPPRDSSPRALAKR